MLAVVTLLFAAAFLIGPPTTLSLMGRSPRWRHLPWLVGAALAVAVSWDLPSPWFSEYTATFSQHLVGGGISSGFVAMYFIAHLQMPAASQRFLIVVVVASVLGVANEVLELGLDLLRGTTLRRDASFDLLANMMGATATWVVSELFRKR
ncbi:MAG: hypothetical protein OEY55_04220 [Acidimicrobiia bacterium]|nr:hypothetical protein [Acidimicrobiia bacterium]MDH5504320.1 hypothetical protein [Acidimicrobiia bacterium]